MLSGNDTLGLLPTGGGKSITFQIPAMLLPGLTIVVSPLISLMKDQVDNLRERGLRAYFLHSGLTRSEVRLAMDRCRLGKTKMLYVSPEKLQSASFVGELRTWDVSLIVVDEAHCISQWGYDFRPSYMKIKELRRIFPDAPVLALTASATADVAEDIMRQLEFRGRNIFSRSFSRDNLSYVVRYCDHKEGMMLKVLNSTSGSAIIYVRSRRRTRELACVLQKEGIPADFYHAGLDPKDKEEKQNGWKSGITRVMVATTAFGMGIDKADVRVVIHYDLPSSLEEYYQEAGRAGRDGKPSFAVVLASKGDKSLLSRRLNDAFPPRDFIVKVYELLGNFLEVAVGSGYNQVYECDFNRFCRIYDLRPVMAHSALTLLTQAGYIEFVEEIASRSRVIILADKNELYSVELDPVTDKVFQVLQRCYTGLFSEYVYISESLISSRADVSENEVYDALLALTRMHVVHYVPKKSTPYVYYTTSRELPRYLMIPRAVYEDRKKIMEHRINAMKDFVFNTHDCRAGIMLRYFGDEDARDCGSCDNCRSLKRRSLTESEKEELRRSVIYMAGHDGGCTVEKVLDASRMGRESTIEVIRELADEGKIRCDGNNIKLITG